MKNKTVIYAILNWGLGHATRSAPIIRRLINDGNRVVIISHGQALTLMKEQFPECIFRDIRDKNIQYASNGIMFVFKIVSQFPKMVLGWEYERRKMRELEKEFHPDLVMTEMRLGFWSKNIPSVLITNQLRFFLPPGLKWAEILGEWFNFLVFRHFDHIFVPDIAGEPNLLGDLCHKGRIAKHPNVRFVGCLSSITPDDNPPEKDIDLLISISGPEPQRTMFEEIVLSRIADLSGKVVITLGSPGREGITEFDNGRITIYPHLDRGTMANIMQRAKFVISRSGFSTVNELFVLRKSAMLVPTPGQTEQEYIARHFHRQGIFHYCRQEDLDLKHLPVKELIPPVELNVPVNNLDHIIALLDALCK
ncbi:MAG: hypothetical protein K0B52_03390 [FCB group bacterium]|nr:hypothetical protein [FCB group bacterium]